MLQSQLSCLYHGNIFLLLKHRFQYQNSLGHRALNWMDGRDLKKKEKKNEGAV